MAGNIFIDTSGPDVFNRETLQTMLLTRFPQMEPAELSIVVREDVVEITVPDHMVMPVYEFARPNVPVILNISVVGRDR